MAFRTFERLVVESFKFGSLPSGENKPRRRVPGHTEIIKDVNLIADFWKADRQVILVVGYGG